MKTAAMRHSESAGPHDEALPSNADASASVGPERKRSRVLIVDDESSILKSLSRLLRREPYDVMTAECGDSALRMLANESVQLVISDHRMPKMTGTELLEQVRSRYPDTIRMILSGYAEINAILKAINDGAIYRFLTKPWNDEELKLSIRRALEQYELLAENRRLYERIRIQNEQLVRANEQLSQRSADASLGLACAQNLIESVDVAVIVVDANRLIVSANRRARDYVVRERCVPVGLPLDTALHSDLVRAMTPTDGNGQGVLPGLASWDGREIEWRVNRIGEGGCVADVIVIWERCK